MTLAEILAGIDSVVTPGKRRLADLMRNPVAYTQQAFGQVGDNVAQFGRNAVTAQEGQDLTRMGSVMGNAPQYRGALSSTLQGLLNVAPVGMMIGPKAKTWDAGAAAKAAQMEKSGIDPRVIWKETGTWKGPDGNWRQEVSDKGASFGTDVNTYKYSTAPNTEISNKYKTIGRSINHDALFSAYPELTGIQYSGSAQFGPSDRFWKDPSGVVKTGSHGGFFDPLRNQIESSGVGYTRKEAKDGVVSGTLHELQHAIQKIEDMSRGGSPEDFSYAMAEKLGETKTSLYRKLAGEAEARATQARIPLNAAQRRAMFPADSYDVPLEQLIFR